MKKSICAIDIGSATTKILVCQRQKNGLTLLFKDIETSEGVKKGAILDPEKTARVLKKLLGRIEENLKTRIDSAFFSLGGVNLFSLPARATISVSRADLIISQEDVERVLKEAKTVGLGHNREIFEVIPKEFSVDGEKGIRDPKGLRGTRLEAETLLLGCFSPHLEKIKETAFRTDLEVLDLIPSPLACAKAVLNEKQKENGVCLLDIGAQTTSLAVFEEGNLIHLKVLPIGSQAVTNEIAISFKLEPEIAERIKIEYGSLNSRKKSTKEKVEVGEENLVFSQKILSKIIQQKFSEIFFEVKKELKEIKRDKKLPCGVVLTGGGAKIPQIVQFAKEKLRLYCQLGTPKGILNLEEEPIFSVAAGLILLGNEIEEREARERGDLFSKIKKFFKIFIP